MSSESESYVGPTGLDHRIAAARIRGRSTMRTMGGLNHEHEMTGIIQAGIILRTAPDHALARRVMAQDPQETTIGRMFRKVVNASIEHPSLDHLPHFESRGASHVAVCEWAEADFVDVYKLLKAGRSIPSRNPRIFYGEDGQATVMQKRQGTMSGFLLRDVAIDNVLYDAGSLVGLRLHDDDSFIEEQDRTPGPAALPSALIDRMAFMRPSIVMLDESERATYTPDWQYLSLHPDHFARLRTVSLADVCGVANDALASQVS